MKKSILVALLAALVVSALSACGAKETDTSAQNGADTTVTQNETIDPDAIVGDICTEFAYLDGFTFTSSSTELGALSTAT